MSLVSDTKPLGGRPLLREWLIFAICLGLGGHVALGVLLHAPALWSLREAGFNGLLTGVGLYVVVQVGRGAWWLWKGWRKAESGATGW